jgi:hypothetical protein
MKLLVFFTLLFLGLSCTSSKSQEISSAFDFFPNSTKDAEANNYLKMKTTLLKNLPFSARFNITSTYQRQKNDTIVQLFFDDEKLVARAFVFPFKNFDSSALFTNLRKFGDVILHKKIKKREPIGAFRKGSDVYYIFETSIAVALMNRPGVDKTTRPTGPMIEPAQTQ